ncbi:MAG: hypothetical protein OQK47_09220, partial [Gammaproteobacteria bacterium]|nr:hypothetical protein [Gammaproteobacteria bacterium]
MSLLLDALKKAASDKEKKSVECESTDNISNNEESLDLDLEINDEFPEVDEDIQPVISESQSGKLADDEIELTTEVEPPVEEKIIESE